MIPLDEFAGRPLAFEPESASLGAVILDLDSGERASSHVLMAATERARGTPAVLVGVSTEAAGPDVAAFAAELSFSLVAQPSGAWGIVVDDPIAAAVEASARVAASPYASRVLCQVLRVNVDADVPPALWVESVAYSSLLGGESFKMWRRQNPSRPPLADEDPVSISRREDVLEVRLTRPRRRNALDEAARRGLVDAFSLAIADPALVVELSGEGPSFCSGGDLDEFGTATDLAEAHYSRTEHSPAALMHLVADRTTAYVHGPCVGAGVELPAFAAQVVARADATFRLPEVSMGLIPGSGGTVSVTRRIGRWRTAWLAATGTTLGAEEAKRWGLVDRVT